MSNEWVEDEWGINAGRRDEDGNIPKTTVWILSRSRAGMQNGEHYIHNLHGKYCVAKDDTNDGVAFDTVVLDGIETLEAAKITLLMLGGKDVSQ